MVKAVNMSTPILDVLNQGILVGGSAGAAWQLATTAGILRRRLQLGDEPARSGEDIATGAPGVSNSLSQDGEPGAADTLTSAYYEVGATAVRPGSGREAMEKGVEQRMVGTASGQAPEGAATESQECPGRKAMEIALLAVQEQLARIEEQVRGTAAISSLHSRAVQTMMYPAHNFIALTCA